MKIIVSKFGGSSLGDSNKFKKVFQIVKADENRKFIVASAPGKANASDSKITDLLYLSYDLANNKITIHNDKVPPAPPIPLKVS